jgi:hypothetical protein
VDLPISLLSNFTQTILGLGDLVLLSNILISHEEPFVKPSATSMFAVRSYLIQFPLRTAAAKTIHKSQGDTLDQVVVSLKSKCKAKIPHIHYVALSRVRSRSGLQILDFNKEKIAVSEYLID